MDEFHTQQEGPVDTSVLHLDIPHTAEFGIQSTVGDYTKVGFLPKISGYRLKHKIMI